MSFQYQCSVGNYLRDDLQFYREENAQMQLEIDELVRQRDDAMDEANHFETEMEHWRNAAKYWQVRYEESVRDLENKNATK